MRYLFLLGGLMMASAGHAAVRVKDVSLGRTPRGWRVDVQASAKAAYTVHALPSPDRIIIDIPNATLATSSQVKPITSSGAKNGADAAPALRFSQFSRKPAVVRIVLDLPARSKWFEISASPAMSIALIIPNAPSSETPRVASKPAARPEPRPTAAHPTYTGVKNGAKAARMPERSPKPLQAGKPVATATVGKRTATGNKPATGRKPAVSKKPAGPVVLSARDLEREMLKRGPLSPAEKDDSAASASSRPRTTRRSNAKRSRTRTSQRPASPRPVATSETRSSESRSSISSRDGFVDRSELMGTMLSLPAANMALPPVEPAPSDSDSPAPATLAPAWIPEEAVALISAGDCPAALRRRLIEVVSDPAIQTSHYVWGAETPGQFDCSGLALYIYSSLDVKLPRVSAKQAEYGEPVDRAALRAGDLLFFNTRGKDISHVGIYLGDGRFLHAANPRENLQITSLDSPYYAKRFVTARRVFDVAVASAANSVRQGG